MIFAGCHTGVDGDPNAPNSGNLIYQAEHGQGVDAAFGFTELVYWPMGNDWASSAGNHLASGEVVNTAMFNAGQDVQNRWFGNSASPVGHSAPRTPVQIGVG